MLLLTVLSFGSVGHTAKGTLDSCEPVINELRSDKFRNARNNAADCLISENWDDTSHWAISLFNDINCTIELKPFLGINNDGLEIEYNLIKYKLKPGFGWVNINKNFGNNFTAKTPITFLIKSASTDNLELKFMDSDGSVFGKKIALENKYSDWTRIVIYLNNTDYWWGGNNVPDDISGFAFAISGRDSGKVWIDEIGIGKEGLEPSFSLAGPVLDPDSTLKGIGFKQRRDLKMKNEDPLVLEYLKAIQDVSSSDRKLLPSMEGDEAHTFNNSLVAMAFILKNERERAERILDFYSNATIVDNSDLQLQNFYYQGEARGFYQHVSLSTYRDEPNVSDRWIGDMAWLLMAYKFYEKKYQTNRYDRIIGLIKDLLISYYREDGDVGYIQHGWRNGDTKLHEDQGHHEGNIDCYVALKLCGADYYADKIKGWLDKELKNNKNLPLDLYSWRVLAFGKGYEGLLNIPEYDFRYRKILETDGEKVMGFYHGPDMEINNIWVDGTGHIACAFLSYGEKERGYFYANQLDNLVIERTINNKVTHALPYTINRTGGYEWVDTTKGFISCAAWYIFAKNEFNPLSEW